MPERLLFRQLAWPFSLCLGAALGLQAYAEDPSWCRLGQCALLTTKLCFCVVWIMRITSFFKLKTSSKKAAVFYPTAALWLVNATSIAVFFYPIYFMDPVQQLSPAHLGGHPPMTVGHNHLASSSFLVKAFFVSTFPSISSGLPPVHLFPHIILGVLPVSADTSQINFPSTACLYITWALQGCFKDPDRIFID